MKYMANLVFTLSLLVSTQAISEVLNYTFTGSYTRILVLGPGGAGVRAAFNSGDTFVLELNYDTDSPATLSPAPTDTYYDGAGSLSVLYSNGYGGGLINNRVSVKNNGLLGSNWTWDSFGMSDSPDFGDNIGNATLVAVNFTLSEATTGTVFNSTDLVPLPPLNLFTNQKRIELVYQDYTTSPTTTAYVNGTILEDITPSDDSDDDGILDDDDNCPNDANTDQADLDNDGQGDVCDADDDDDSTVDSEDNCPTDYNFDQADLDNDGLGDVCDNDDDGDSTVDTEDNCPNDANADQADLDNDGLGDVCDNDDDGDGVDDNSDNCPISDSNPSIVIDGCDSGVSNTAQSNGCTVLDNISECAANASNHGKYVSCVAKLTNSLKKSGLITGKQKGAIQSCAAQANIP